MKLPNNPYLKRIGSLVGEKDPRKSVAVFVEANRTAAITLEALASKLGVSRILEETLPYEGGLFKLPDGELVVKLNAASSFVRKRFTLAHEIGHLLLETVPAFRKATKTDEALERTCDLIAAELLMPTREATQFIYGLGSPSPEKLSQVAAKYSVSIQTAAIRVHDDFRLWRCCIGMWEIGARARTVWFVGRRRWNSNTPDSRCLELALESEESLQITDLWPRGTFTERVWLNLRKAGNARVLGLVNFVN